MLIIGLTGGLATGKSTVAKFLAQCGARVIDADQVVHDLLESNADVRRRIVRTFGESVLTGQTAGRIKKINRRKLAELVFNNRRNLKQLEAILHPAVRVHMMKMIRNLAKKKVGDVVLDVPLLFEKGLDRLTDITIAVRATRQQQMMRARRRLRLTRSQFLERTQHQMPLSRKMRLADQVIDNRGTVLQTRRQVKEFWRQYHMNKNI